MPFEKAVAWGTPQYEGVAMLTMEDFTRGPAHDPAGAGTDR